jgi:hypothetical protein
MDEKNDYRGFRAWFTECVLCSPPAQRGLPGTNGADYRAAERPCQTNPWDSPQPAALPPGESTAAAAGSDDRRIKVTMGE